MGPLLIIFVGLALFAFIAGDAWKIFQPHQGQQEVGEINGENITAEEYQTLLNEYTEVIKFARGNTQLGDEEMNQVKDEVWSTLVRNKLIEKEASKLGLTVTDAEMQATINAGQDPMLMQTPFRNQQTGRFDKDLLNNFLTQYEQNKDNAQFVEQYKSLYTYWQFIEKSLKQNLLASKYQSLLGNSFVSNPVAAQASFDGRNTESDILVASYPFYAMSDSAITIDDKEYQAAYDQKKEQFKQYAETRDIKYVAYQVVPSQADKDALNKEVAEYATTLGQAQIPDEAIFMRQTNSTVPYSQVAWSKSAYPADIAARMDSAAIGQVYGPFYNQMDNSYNVFKITGKVMLPDSVQYRQIVAAASSKEAGAKLADSIMTALDGGADFAVIAKRYGQEGKESWLTSKDYEGMNVVDDNAVLLNTLFGMKKGERKLLTLEKSKANIIVEVLDSRNPIEKYSALVVKRVAEFSNDTYNAAYNAFSQFVASCNSLDDMSKKAETAGYHAQELKGFASNSHNVAGIHSSVEALRWAYAAKEGEVSPLYECGDNDMLLVVGLEKINKEGYTPLDIAKEALRPQIAADKKAAKIIPMMKGDFTTLATVPNVKIDTLKHVSFSAPAFVGSTNASEPVLSARVSMMQAGQTSAPFEGKGGVYVVQVLTKNSLGLTYNAQSEEASLRAAALQSSYRFLNDLYLKGKVTDKRYLYF